MLSNFLISSNSVRRGLEYISNPHLIMWGCNSPTAGSYDPASNERASFNIFQLVYIFDLYNSFLLHPSETVVTPTCRIKYLQKCKNVLVFYFTCNHVYNIFKCFTLKHLQKMTQKRCKTF